MPYRTPYRRYRRRRSYKKRSTAMTKYQRPKDTFDYARQAWKAAMQLKRMVNVEYKKHYFSEASIAMSASWQIRTLSLVPQGDGSFQRDGVSIKPQNLTVSLRMSTPAASQSTTWRVVVLRGKHEQGDGPTEYLNAYEDGTTAIDILKFKNNLLKYNSQTLKDTLYHVESTNPVTGNTDHIKRFNIKLTGHTTFDGTSTDAEDGGLYILFCCVDTTAGAVLAINSVLSFTDN